VARNGIAHVPEGREIFPFMTVRGNLLMGAYARADKVGIEKDMEVVYSYFPVLRERADQAAGFLSGGGGQQQMLAIGRGLMARPRLMLLDEPSLGLSPILTKEIFGIVRRLNQEQGVTMLLVEQNANMALKTAHYGYVLETGRIVLEGACDKLAQNEDVREFYLGQKETAVRRLHHRADLVLASRRDQGRQGRHAREGPRHLEVLHMGGVRRARQGHRHGADRARPDARRPCGHPVG
jgi:branched-chain amino acid transport system ATP-binding protein